MELLFLLLSFVSKICSEPDTPPRGDFENRCPFFKTQQNIRTHPFLCKIKRTRSEWFLKTPWPKRPDSTGKNCGKGEKEANWPVFRYWLFLSAITNGHKKKTNSRQHAVCCKNRQRRRRASKGVFSKCVFDLNLRKNSARGWILLQSKKSGSQKSGTQSALSHGVPSSFLQKMNGIYLFYLLE